MSLPTTSSDASARKRCPLGRRLLLSLALLPVYLLAAELAYRGWLFARGEPYSAERVRSSLFWSAGAHDAPATTVDEPQNNARFLHPYIGWTDADTIHAIDRDVAYFRTSEATRTFDVLVLGGSVAMQFGNQGAEAIEKCLRRDPRLAERPIRVLGYGKLAFKQPQQVMFLTWLMSLGFHPDAVIELDGFNEATLGSVNVERGVHETQPYVDMWATLAAARDTNREDLELFADLRASQTAERAFAQSALNRGVAHSAILGTMAQGRLAKLQSESMVMQKRFIERLSGQSSSIIVHGPSFDGTPEAAAEDAVRSWYECSLAISAVCRAHGIIYVHALQPTLLEPGTKPATEEELASAKAADSWVTGVRLAYPKMREAGARLRANGVDFVDATGVFRDIHTSLYVDVCHFAPQGCWPLADVVTRALLDDLPKQ
jgi:hypothetical protein